MADNFWDAYTAAYDVGQKQGQSAMDALGRMTDRQAGQAFASGDYTGASNIFARSGNLQNAEQLQTYGLALKLAQAKAVTDAGLTGINALSQIPVEQRQAYFQSQVAPVLRQHGVPDAQIQQWGSGPMDDQHLQAEASLLGQARDKLEFLKVGDAQVGVSPFTGKPQATYMTGQPPAAAAPAAAPAPAGIPAPSGPAYAQIGQTAATLGASPEETAYLQRTAQIESGGNPNPRRNGSSTGLFQFHPDTFAAAGGGDINSPTDQTRAALTLARRSAQALQQAGIPATPANLYIMHQQGPGGGAALLTADPNTNAIAALTPAYQGRANIARRAIIGNGGNPNMTAGQFVQMWQAKFGGGAPTAALASPAPAAAQPAPTAGITETSPGVYMLPSSAAALKAPAGYRYKADGATLEAIPGGPADTGDTALSSASIDLLAGAFLKDRTLPPLGMGKAAAANRDAILNRASQMAKDLGIDANDLVSGAVSVKAAGAALGKLTTMRAQIAASEGAISRNGDYVLSLAPKGADPTGVPIFNAWVQAGRKATGNPNVAAFDAAIGGLADEYGRGMTTSTGAGGQSVSDAARKEAYGRLSKAFTIPQLEATIAAMKTEMQNRAASYADMETGLRQQVRNPGGVPGAPGAAPSPGGGPPASGFDKQAYIHDVTGARAAVRSGAYTKAQARQRLMQEYPSVPSGAFDQAFQGL